MILSTKREYNRDIPTVTQVKKDALLLADTDGIIISRSKKNIVVIR
jgi:hypothetical protein